MAFIEKSEQVVINARLTTIGRKLLASGALTFNQWVLGDSEIDYTYGANTGFDLTESIILRPKDKNPNIKYPILASENGTPFNVLPPLTPVETRVRNTAKVRGFFTGNTANGFTALTTSQYVVQNKLKIDLSTVTGGTTLKISQDTGYVYYAEPLIGDLLFVDWVNPVYTGSTHADGVILPNSTTPHLWYQIENLSGSASANTLVVTVDRKTPNFSGAATGKTATCLVYPGGDAINNYYGSGETTSYWNENTLAFNSSCNIANDDVPVWNMNIVYSEELAGKQTGYEPYGSFGSSAYTGFKNYVSQTFDNPSKKSIGIIHYTNHSINNFYGEQLYANTPVLELPTVIWYNSSANTIGLTLKCDTTLKTAITGFAATDLNTSYYDLIDGNGFIVGKCFINLKLFTIEDEELVAAMSYKSNRNWAYPTMVNPGNTSGIAITRPNVFTTINQKLYVTYLLENSSGYTANISYGYANGLHCQNYVEYLPDVNPSTNVLTNINVPQFTLDSGSLKYLASTTSFNTGNGLTFNKFKVLYQLVNNQSTRPDPTLWKEYDYTSKLNGYPFTNNIIPASAFASQLYSIDNNVITGGTTYNLNNYLSLPTTSQPEVLNFGDEVFFFGNIKTDIEATVFKTKFIIQLPFNQFNTSTNPTWTDSGLSVYASEIGVYDSFGNLVVIGKLSFPLEKKSSKIGIIELSIDF